jgi:type 1 glutamine amidotransferase
MLDWVGAYYDFEGYGSVHRVSRKPLDCSPTSPDHPISRGWKKFTLKENEMYHNLKFAEGAAVVPILTAPLMPQGKGNANVTAWALEPKSGGRGFAFGGGHFFSMWKNEDCRRMMLNGILWSAKIQVPFDGVQTNLAGGK